MLSSTTAVVEKSPFFVRTSCTLAQSSAILADWSMKKGLAKAVTLVTEFAPGLEAEETFTNNYKAAGGQIAEAIRVPLRNPDFAPFLQRVRDTSPDAVFVFVPSGVGAIFMKQFSERGLDKSGIKLIGTGDVTDDDILNDMGDVALGVITSFHYSAAHNSATNKAYVEAFKKLNGFRPNFMSLGGYDGMRLIYRALEATKGSTDGMAMVNAMKGLQFESPRGPVTIDPATREPVQNVYLRKVENVNGELYNIEFETVTAVKDPTHK
jgi:branched-chain amino acid transport system substrate-binding protein